MDSKGVFLIDYNLSKLARLIGYSLSGKVANVTQTPQKAAQVPLAERSSARGLRTMDSATCRSQARYEEACRPFSKPSRELVQHCFCKSAISNREPQKRGRAGRLVSGQRLCPGEARRGPGVRALDVRPTCRRRWLRPAVSDSRGLTRDEVVAHARELWCCVGSKPR
jgi:hypothetical protein